ncbi:MAG: TIM barrel protein [Lachnospiraceae bacterium]|nr:TIM barrel protein [Lachnospiraceae bacterium]
MKIKGIPEVSRIDEWVACSKKYDIAFEYNDFFNPWLLDHKERLEEVINIYLAADRDRSQDTLHGAFFDIVVGSSDPKIEEVSMFRIRQSLDIAKRLGVKGVIFHTNYLTSFKLNSYLQGWLNANQKTFTALCDEYYPMNIYMENMFDVNPDLLVELAIRMDSVKNFGVCLDLAHAYISGTNITNWLDEVLPYTKHLHVNDNFGNEDSHLPIGEGDFDWDILNDDRIRKTGADILLEVKNGLAGFEKSLKYLVDNKIYPYNK